MICYGLKCIFYQSFKGLSTEQDDENSHNSVCHSVALANINIVGLKCRILYMFLWPFMLVV